MSISIITPHFNDFDGIKQIHNCLINQDSSLWEWIIVDDFSDNLVKKLLKDYFDQHDCSNIKLIYNEIKTNASVCRNIGIDNSTNERLVFLDSDDVISEGFVSNRLINVSDFVVFRNLNVLYENGNHSPFPFSKVRGNYLNYFLQAKLVWQTTAILWNKSFLIQIGKFDPNLMRLQDVELSIRALFLGTKYEVIDNKVDFFYRISTTDINKRPVKVICDSVNYLISSIHDNYKLDIHQQKLIKGYYYVCVRYFVRSKVKLDATYLKKSLNLFYSKKYISLYGYFLGFLFLEMFNVNLLSDKWFIKLNRYFYK